MTVFFRYRTWGGVGNGPAVLPDLLIGMQRLRLGEL